MQNSSLLMGLWLWWVVISIQGKWAVGWGRVGMGLGKTMDQSIVRIWDDEEDEASVKLHCASNTGIILLTQIIRTKLDPNGKANICIL